jgi:hypothetical protein
MPKVTRIVYELESGAKIDYNLDDPEDITDEAMSAIIQLIDGKVLIELANETADIQDRDF